MRTATAGIHDRLVEVGIVLLIVLTPLYYGSVSLGAIAAIELTILLMLLAWGTGMLLRGELVFARTPLDIPILLFCACVIVLSLFFSAYHYVSYQGLLLVLCLSALYFIVVNNVHSRKQLLRLFVLILATGFIQAFSHLLRNASGFFRSSTGTPPAR